MGAILKGVKKRKTLTTSFPRSKLTLPPRKGEVIIKKKRKPSTTKLADTWQDRRIQAINRKIKKSRGRSTEDYAQEVSDIYKSKAPSKKLYKSVQKKWHSLDSAQKDKIWMKRAQRRPESIHFDKKRFGKK